MQPGVRHLLGPLEENAAGCCWLMAIRQVYSPKSRSCCILFEIRSCGGNVRGMVTMNSASGAGPLAGMVTLDLTQILAGPMCTMVLADMGADVIKIEKPNGGDDNRRMGTAVHQGLVGGVSGRQSQQAQPGAGPAG